MTSRRITALPHLNGNPLAAIDVETTGRCGGYHEIVQIAIVPLAMDLEIAKYVRPFYQNMRPMYPERVEPRAVGMRNVSVDDLLMNAPEPERVLDYLIEWYARLPLGHGRKLTPLAHNWAFDSSFLIPWLGPDLYTSLFYPLPRDTMNFASSLNDRAVMAGYVAPFKSVNLGALCRQFGVVNDNEHNALADAIATAKLYQAMMRACL